MTSRDYTVPLSEDVTKITDATADEIIAEIRAIAEAHPEKVISRNFFRVYGSYAESAWNRHFGTFAELKRIAGIVLSRHQHRHERDIAKHASKDVQRRLNVEKRDFSGSYLRPSSKRFQTALIASDVHGQRCDPFFARVLVDAARRVQPEKIVLNGDLFDLSEFSKYTNDPRRFDILGDISAVHGLLGQLREAAPDAEMSLVEGNHEVRLLRHLGEATPALKVILSDLHGMTVASLLGLDKFQVNLIARADLAAFNERDVKAEVAKNYLILWDAILCHHFPEGRAMGMPGTNGHHHKHLVSSHYSPTYGPYEWHQTGCGHVRNSGYCAGEKWSNGFLLAHVDTEAKHTAFDYIDIREFAVMGGEFYFRAPGESVYPRQ